MPGLAQLARAMESHFFPHIRLLGLCVSAKIKLWGLFCLKPSLMLQEHSGIETVVGFSDRYSACYSALLWILEMPQ